MSRCALAWGTAVSQPLWNAAMPHSHPTVGFLFQTKIPTTSYTSRALAMFKIILVGKQNPSRLSDSVTWAGVCERGGAFLVRASGLSWVWDSACWKRELLT